jgi:antitoxin (DNA-binding transcriptional repressor) of toxin-antitoxin stability system
VSVIKINDMKDQLEELVTRVQAGETILIEKDGQTVARLEGIVAPAAKSVPEKFNWEALRRFTDSLPPAKESAADLIRRMRDESY